MENKIIALLLISLSFISCKKDNHLPKNVDKSELTVIRPLAFYKKELVVSDFVSDIKYILPKVDKLIKIDDLIIEDNYIYLIDNSINYEIYCVNHEGLHIYSISNYGGAENEYYNISNVVLSDFNIEIFDITTQKKLVFNKTTGEWINSTKIDYNFELSNIEIFDNKYLIYHGNSCVNQKQCFNYHIVDNEFVVLEKLLKVPNNLESYTLNMGASIYKHDNKIYFKELFNDTIYKINQDNKVSSFLFVDFQERALPDEIKYDRKNNDIGTFITNFTFNGDYIFGLRDMVINDKIIFLEFFNRNKVNEIFYDIETKKTISYSSINIKNNKELINSPKYSYKDYFVSVLDVEQILSLKNDEMYYEYTKSILNQQPDFSIESNPVIVLYKVDIN